MKLICACAAAALLPAWILPSPAAQDRTPLSLGLIRPDGILLPIAVLDAGKWIDPWPEATDDMRLDHMIEAVPSYWRQRRQQVPQRWHVTAPPSTPLTRTNVLTHVVYGEHCGNQVGLLTDLQRTSDDAHDKRLALSRQVPIALPIRINEAGGEWRGLAARVRQEVARQEASAIAEEEKHFGRPSELEPPVERGAITLRRMYGHHAAGVRALYYEAERAYKRPFVSAPGAEPAVLVASGWILQTDGSAPAGVDGRAVITDPDHKTALTMTPLAILTVDGAIVWVVIEHGYESESASVIQITRDGVRRVLTKFIGGC